MLSKPVSECFKNIKRMSSFQAIEKWIVEDEFRLECLNVASSILKQEWFLAAGFVRNLVWDKLQGHKISTPLNDVDVIHFSLLDISKEQDIEIENKLNKYMPNCSWSVKNQARMAVSHGHNAYSGCIEAMSYWPEIQTAVGVTKTKKGSFNVNSPFLAQDVVKLAATRNKKCSLEVFNSRVRSKNWKQLWPELRIET